MKEEEDWGFLLIDASNAFNEMNWTAMLWQYPRQVAFRGAISIQLLLALEHPRDPWSGWCDFILHQQQGRSNIGPSPWWPMV
jgi:hypothetical protein